MRDHAAHEFTASQDMADHGTPSLAQAATAVGLIRARHHASSPAGEGLAVDGADGLLAKRVVYY